MCQFPFQFTHFSQFLWKILYTFVYNFSSSEPNKKKTKCTEDTQIFFFRLVYLVAAIVVCVCVFAYSLYILLTLSLLMRIFSFSYFLTKNFCCFGFDFSFLLPLKMKNWFQWTINLSLKPAQPRQATTSFFSFYLLLWKWKHFTNLRWLN